MLQSRGELIACLISNHRLRHKQNAPKRNGRVTNGNLTERRRALPLLDAVTDCAVLLQSAFEHSRQYRDALIHVIVELKDALVSWRQGKRPIYCYKLPFQEIDMAKDNSSRDLA
jgi:hypothetical protein